MMARLFDDAQVQYCEIDDNLGITGPPFWVSAWAYKDDDATTLPVLWIGDKDTAEDWYVVAYAFDETSSAYVQSAGEGAVRAKSGTSGSNNKWHHVFGAFTAANHRMAYLDGGGRGDDSWIRTPSGLNRTCVGRWADSTPANYASGRVAQAAIGTGIPTDAQIAALANGFDPRLVLPRSSIKAIWPLLADDRDTFGNYDLTPYNSPSWADHPPLIHPSRPQVVEPAESAGASQQIPWHLLHGRAV